jgi:hypothetical protein
MFSTAIVNAVDLVKLEQLYAENKDTIDTNTRSDFDTIKRMFVHACENKLNAEITKDGEVAGYTTGIVKNKAYYCTNVVVGNNKAFILSGDSFCKVLRDLDITAIKGHVKTNTPMYDFLLASFGRKDLFNAEVGLPIEGHDGIIITLNIL